MKLKPNILDEINSDPTADSAVSSSVSELASMVSQSDSVVLEDESGRVTLNLTADGIPKEDKLVTGAVMAFMGTLAEDGSLVVEDCCAPGLPPQVDTGLAAAGADAQSETESDPLLLLVSGLSLGDPKSDPLACDLLIDYVTGNLGGSADHAEAARIAQVIIAGSSCYTAPAAAQGGKADEGAVRAKHRADASPLQELDLILTRLCASVPVDVMSGPGDPCCMYMPQQPMLPCLLPSAKTYNTLRTTTNPYEAIISVKSDKNGKGKTAEDARVLLIGTSGQNVADVIKYSTLDGSLDILERLLEWRHLAPTAPDTLACFPMRDEDPFIIEQSPHIFFAGNQREFGATTMTGDDKQKVLVVSVPSFAATHTAVLVNLRTLQARPIDFSCDAFE